MAERTTRWCVWTALALAAAGTLAVGRGVAHESAQTLPPLVAPGPNACLQGSGSRNWCGDGGPATKAKLGGPQDVAVAPDGSLVIADTANNVIRRVTPDGTIGTIAGDGADPKRRPRASEPAARPRFDHPAGVAVAPDGSVLVADTGNDAVRRITPDGRVEIVLGGRGRVGTQLSGPTDVVALPSGDVLVADTENHRVLRLTAAGAVVLVAGVGLPGRTGDGGPATEAALAFPAALAARPDGGLLIADRGTGAVRSIDPSGTITTVAAPSGGLAGVAVSPDGAVIAARAGRSEVVRLEPAAVRIAGTGQAGFTGDGRATQVALSQPRQLAVAQDGSLLIAEAGNDRIRRLGADGSLTTVAGRDRPRSVASVPPDEDAGGGTPAPVPGGGGDDGGGSGLARCFRQHPRFQVFSFVPVTKRMLSARRTRLSVRIQTSVSARVEVVLKRGRTTLRRRVIERVSNARVSTVVKLRARLSPRTRYVVQADGRSLVDPDIERCDRRRVRVA